MGVHPYWPEQISEKNKPVEKFTEWIRTKNAGRIGLGFDWGDKEIFVGVTINKIELETVIRRKQKKVKVTNQSHTVDI